MVQRFFLGRSSNGNNTYFDPQQQRKRRYKHLSVRKMDHHGNGKGASAKPLWSSLKKMELLRIHAKQVH